VDDFYGLDRLDRWLNSRQGKQRAVLNWFQVFMLSWYLCMLGGLAWAFFGSVPLIAVPGIALAAAVLAVPFRRLIPAMYARRSRRSPDKTGPEFTWRWMVMAFLFAIAELLGAVNASVGQSLPHGLRDALALLQAIVALSALPVLFTLSRYTRRYSQARQERLVGAAALQNSSRGDPPWPTYS
jgi:hypothetical protein